MREYVKNAARAAGLFRPARQLAERARVLKRLLRPAPPVPLHRDEDIEPFFIVGSGRCGTTLLRRLLQASPEVHIPPENWSLGGCIATFRQYRWLLSWETMVDLLLGRHAMESHRWFDEPPSELRERLRKLPDDDRSLCKLVDEMYRYHGERQEATFRRWGDKTPLNVRVMNEIIDVFPNAKFIHLLRDGIDVVHSYSKRSDYSGNIEVPAQRWKDAVATARKFARRHPGQLLEVRYERLCREPEKIVQRVCRFTGLSYDADMLSRADHHGEMRKAQSIAHYENAFKSISTDSIGKGRVKLSAMQKKKIALIIDDELIHLGYGPAEV